VAPTGKVEDVTTTPPTPTEPVFDPAVLGTPERPTFGLDTFGDTGTEPDGTPRPQAEAIREVVAEGVLADQVGVDYLGLGEHHREDYAISAPDVVLSAIAGQTERIRLGTGVTVLSSDDPIRVFQRFSTLAAISRGRAEVQLGRGSFTESFPLFGLDLSDYEVLFHEKLDLFAHLQQEQPLTWRGSVRPPLEEQQVFPRTEAGLPTSSRASRCSPTRPRRSAGSAASAAGAPTRRPPSTRAPRPRARSSSAHPRPSRRRSPGRCARSASPASR
jgi:alkanesulfonate monooxygenase SsuD/methylene tetrahydromethanopterin reductase-like flavin-dependent oxidoreductase (luciferase family)